MIWTAWVNGERDRYPVELTNEHQPIPSANKTYGTGDRIMASCRDLYVGHRFRVDITDARENEQEARRQFNVWRDKGLPANPWTSNDPPANPGEKKRWRHRGAPHYLYAQARLMGLPDIMVKEAGGNEEIWKLDREMAGLSTQYSTVVQAQCGKIDDFLPHVKAAAAGSLQAYERRSARLHMLAAASRVELDDAWSAFAMDIPERTYRVVVGPPPVVEVRSTEDVLTIKQLGDEIMRLDKELEAMKAGTCKDSLQVQPGAVDTVAPAAVQTSTLPPEPGKPKTHPIHPKHGAK